MNNNPMDDLFASETMPPCAFIIKQLEVYNWGPFSGRACAHIDPQGTSIIGPTGSGKTTLVDALMTLITAQPRYNLASTGGHESDRDLLSYIRGVSGAGNNSGDNSHVARTDKTTTAISALFSNGSTCVRIGALFWLEGSSSASADLKRLWCFTERDDQSLSSWLELHHEGGARALKQKARETSGLQVFDSKKSYLAQLRRFFEVGENAFTLLNRAAGLKQLNSIDEVFRELVLDDRSAFNRASEVANEFDDLASIHSELQIARRQQQSLLPIEQTNQRYQATQQKHATQRTVLQALPIWFATHGYQLWKEQEQALHNEIERQKIQVAEQQQAAENLQDRANILRDSYLQAGGASIEQLHRQIETQQALTQTRQRNATQYQRMARQLELDDNLSASALYANQQQVKTHQQRLESQQQTLENDSLQWGAKLVKQQSQAASLSEELSSIRARPGSNIPARYQDFRAELASALTQPETDLPFVAELIETRPEEQPWRGAIERAIGGHRLRILVPEAQMKAALEWVNQRDNRLHVRLLEASAPDQPAQFMSDGFTRKLNFKTHPHRESLKHFLASIDRHCVASAEALRGIEHGMTAQGLMSGKRGRFEKQDQQPLHKGWMTGFDNKDRLAALTAELAETETEQHNCQQQYNQVKRAQDTLKDELRLLESLAQLEFSEIDLPGAEADQQQLQQQLDALTDPDSSTARAQRQYEDAKQALEATQQQINELLKQQGRLDTRYKEARRYKIAAKHRLGDGLSDSQQALADSHLKLPDATQLEQFDQLERAEYSRIETACTELDQKLSTLQQQLIRQMAAAKREDTGALAETGTELQDIPDYLERLRLLNEEALPEKLRRFLDYLNQSSDQGVTQLLAEVSNEVTLIEERIADLNQTLKRVDFQPGRYLQLMPQHVVHESLRTLQQAQRHLRATALKDDQGESHYRALENIVQLLRHASDNRRTLGARALLDPRYRLQFAVSVLDRQDDHVIEIRTGSQGGSGGEKEIIASYILTASLSYALCPEGLSRPLFGTIVLDEAFSKSSQAVAGRIIAALHEFGLHPLFVTPNKEMQLLRAHTRSAILVHRKGLQSTLTSLSWEEVTAQARKVRETL